MKMGFFKDFKDDFSEAVNDLVPGAEELDTEDTATDTLCNPICQNWTFYWSRLQRE